MRILGVSPVIECGGESVVLSDHIWKHGDNPLFGMKPCNLQIKFYRDHLFFDDCVIKYGIIPLILS